MTQKFYAGDKVRRIKHDTPSISVGSEWTISRIDSDGWLILEGDLPGEPRSPLFFEHTTAPFPVREVTITRKEIVPGTYGIVQVMHDGRIWVPHNGQKFSPEQLKKAAGVLALLADALEAA